MTTPTVFFFIVVFMAACTVPMQPSMPILQEGNTLISCGKKDHMYLTQEAYPMDQWHA